jgi:beta-lactam-binding protein with PASTA domain
MVNKLDGFLKLPVYVHLLSVTGLFCLIVYITLKCVDSYTNHNQAVIVPDVKGLQIEDAMPFFERNMLRYEVIDSIYSKEITPGAIIDLTPEANSKVKKNRIVYITVNAKTEETAPLPEITEISYRQAWAHLKSRGFANVTVEYVASEYRDLTIGVEYNGRKIQSGTKIPLTSHLVLLIGDGGLNDSDSIRQEENSQVIEGDESWF